MARDVTTFALAYVSFDGYSLTRQYMKRKERLVVDDSQMISKVVRASGLVRLFAVALPTTVNAGHGESAEEGVQ